MARVDAPVVPSPLKLDDDMLETFECGEDETEEQSPPGVLHGHTGWLRSATFRDSYYAIKPYFTIFQKLG